MIDDLYDIGKRSRLFPPDSIAYLSTTIDDPARGCHQAETALKNGNQFNSIIPLTKITATQNEVALSYP